MARIAVVSFPILDAQAVDWIESIRAEHDSQAGRILAHFTLVFPIDASPADVKNELARAAACHEPIPFVIRSATFMPDVIHGGGGHVFLVPNDGRASITRLHDDLYSGVLRPHLRADVAFIPHVTIAAHDDLRWCETYAQRVNGALEPVAGVLESITLVDVTGGKIDTLAEFALGTPQ